MKTKVSEATGRTLNWLVAKAQGATNLRLYTPRSIDLLAPYWVFKWEAEDWREELGNYDPSEDWSLGGPIIEDEGIYYEPLGAEFLAHKDGTDVEAVGPTPLIAGMRCFVASRLGNAVEVPEELK